MPTPGKYLLAESMRAGHRALSDEAERTVEGFIWANFVSIGRRIDFARMELIILLVIHDLIAKKVLDESMLNFTCSYLFSGQW
jgi:hypothetical protein